WRRPQRSCTDNLSEKLYRRGLEATGCVTYLPPEAWRTRLLVRRTIPTAAELNGDVRNLRVVRQVGVRCRRHPLGAPGPSVSPMRRGAKRGRRRPELRPAGEVGRRRRADRIDGSGYRPVRRPVGGGSVFRAPPDFRQGARRRLRHVYAAMRTGIASKPFTKFEFIRFGSPTTSIFGKRRRISSHMMRSCISASRMPTQRWMPKPKETCWRGRSRSMMNSSGRSIASSSRLPETYHMMTFSPFLIRLPP